MKKILLSGVAVAAFSLVSFAPVDELAIGAAMPKGDLKMQDFTGKQVALNDVMGENGLMVMFSCNTCPFVIKNEERTKEVSLYAQKNKVGVILVNSNEGQRSGDDSYEAMQLYAKTKGYEWHYVVDKNSVLADAFGAKRTPEVFLFDKNRKLVYHGAIDDNPSNAEAVKRQHLKIAIDELVAGKEISVKTSKSVGCTIKRVKE